MADELVRQAEEEIIAAAIAWVKAELGRSLNRFVTEEARRLRMAIYMYEKAKVVTGKLKLEDIREAMEKKK